MKSQAKKLFLLIVCGLGMLQMQGQIKIAIGGSYGGSPKITYVESVGYTRTASAQLLAVQGELTFNHQIILQGQLSQVLTGTLEGDFANYVDSGTAVIGGLGYVINGSEKARLMVPVMAHLGGAFLRLTSSVVDGSMEVGVSVNPRMRLYEGLFFTTELRYLQGIAVGERGGTISFWNYGLGLQYQF